MKLYWHTPKRLILEFDEPWMWDDFYTIVEEAHNKCAAIEGEVQLLIWHKVKIPAGNMLMHFGKIERNRPPNLNIVGTVLPPAQGGLLKAISQIMDKVDINRRPVLLFRTLEEAHTGLDKRQQAQEAVQRE
jgi:hypothetical protein